MTLPPLKVWPTYPLPRLHTPWRTYMPTESQSYSPPTHYGWDIMYPRADRRDAERWPPGTTDGSRRYFCPPGVPVLAALPGVVTYARRTRRGGQVTLRHDGELETLYLHLEDLAVEEGWPVQMGARVGTVGWDPLDAERLRHLHFAIRYRKQWAEAPIGRWNKLAVWKWS